MFLFNIFYLNEFIKILLVLYYQNFNIASYLILIYNKFLLLFKYFLLTKYLNNNKNLLLENFILNKKVLCCNLQIENNILKLKITAKTTKSTIVRKFYVLSVIGNKTNWLGFGKAKHKKLSTAVKNSYINAFQNILYFNTNYLNLKNLYLNFKSTKLIIYKHNFTNLHPNHLSNIFNFIGFFMNSKIIGVSSNITNLLYIFKTLSKLNN